MVAECELEYLSVVVAAIYVDVSGAVICKVVEPCNAFGYGVIVAADGSDAVAGNWWSTELSGADSLVVGLTCEWAVV